MSSSPETTYFRKGFGLKSEVQDALASDYDGWLVDYLRHHEFSLSVGRVTVRLAREFGFCYGVERAVDYAYQTRAKFPDRRIVLLGEIIHNPSVNARLRGMGVEIMERPEGGFDFSSIGKDDVVIIPAFGVGIEDFQHLRSIGCVLVDTTCGSVLNVWKRVENYARDGYTALIHGKHYHEETRATASQTRRYPGGQYIVVRNMDEARIVCDYVEGKVTGDALMAKLGKAAGEGFDPARDLRRIGVANQTTMLANESLAIAAEVGAAIERTRGAEARAADFRSFDTICSATQERQDAVKELLQQPLDAMVVIGGFNSSNTISLAALCAERVPTYHVEVAPAIDPEKRTIHYRRAAIRHEELEATDWLPESGPVTVGVTAGASTPNSKIGEAVARILATCGVPAAALEALHAEWTQGAGA